MTFLEAAIEVLREAGKSLPIKDITARAMQRKLLTHEGRTPELTMQARLTQETKRGAQSSIVRVSPTVFGLRAYNEPEPEPEPQPKTSRRRRRRRGKGGAQGTQEAQEPKKAEAIPETGPLVVDPSSERQPHPQGDIDLDAMLSPVLRRRALVELPDDESVAREYSDELTPAPTPLGEIVDERSADEDRQMLSPIEADRDHRHRRRKGREAKQRKAPATQPAPTPKTTPVKAQPEVARATVAQTMALADAAVHLLQSLADPRPIHVRQIVAMALKRRLTSGGAEELAAGFKAALLQDARVRQASGFRPRVRHHGGDLFALATARLEPEVVTAEEQLATSAAVCAAETRKALGRRLTRLPLRALEHLVRLYLERTGWAGLELIRRTSDTAYIIGVACRGSLRPRFLVGIRAGDGELGRRPMGELRAGVVAKQVDEGLVLGGGPLNAEGEGELRMPGPPVEMYDSEALSEELIRAGVGVLRAQVPLSYLDGDFFAELEALPHGQTQR